MTDLNTEAKLDKLYYELSVIEVELYKARENKLEQREVELVNKANYNCQIIVNHWLQKINNSRLAKRLSIIFSKYFLNDFSNKENILKALTALQNIALLFNFFMSNRVMEDTSDDLINQMNVSKHDLDILYDIRELVSDVMLNTLL